jgi:DNA polymerase-3 subunit beta
MKIRFNREEMAAGLGAICGVAATRTPKEILRCVRLEAHPDFVLLSATDLEMGLRCTVAQVEVEERGETLATADTLARIVRESSDDLLAMESEENMLHVRGGDSHFQIMTQDVADFPPVPTIDADPSFTVEYGVLHRLIEWTAHAAAHESTRYAINGVLWEAEEDQLTLAATDGRRLSYAKGPIVGGEAQLHLSAIVPTKALSLVGRLPQDADTPVGVKIVENQLLLQTGRVAISTSLVEGRFPKHQDVIPRDNDKEVVLNTLEFQSALKRASLLTNEESKGVRLSFGEGKLTLSSRAPEQGEATILLPVDYQSEPLEIGFNPVFLLEVLRVAHCDTVSFTFKDSNRPGVIRLGDDFIYVVMPVSLT